MAAIKETPQWEDEVRQVAIGDPVAGGDAGPVNMSVQDLANRTLYLKKAIDAARIELDALSGKIGDLNLADALLKVKNLSDVANKATARNNISAAAADHMHDSAYLKIAQNLSDIDDPDAARAAIGAAALNHMHDGIYTRREDLIGEIIMWPLPVPPKYFLEFNGDMLLIAEFPGLFKVVGNRWGGDGKTTFRLFDARGGLPRAWDNGRGVDPGRAIGTWQEDAGRKVTGTWSSKPPNGGTTWPGYEAPSGSIYTKVSGSGAGNGNGSGPETFGLDSSREWGIEHVADEFRPCNFSVMFCIRYA